MKLEKQTGRRWQRRPAAAFPRTVLAAIGSILLLGSFSSQPLDFLIRDGRVLDGSGNPWQYKNIGVRGDRIVWMGDPSEPSPEARTTLSAERLYVAPGFIDLHSHSAEALGQKGLSANTNFLYQGATTLVTGNDGGSPWPIGPALERYEKVGIGPNAVLLVGHGTVRRQVLGMEDRAPTPAELDRMKALVRQGIQEGAFGLSTGLYYAPGNYASTEEVIALAEEAQKLEGFYDSHIRDEADYSIGLLEAVREVIQIGRQAGLPVHISHIKALGPRVWGQSETVIAEIERARASGVEITANQYPYEASGTSVSGALIPRWVQAGGQEATRGRVRDPEQRKRILAEVTVNLERRGGADKLMISSYQDSSLEGKSLRAVASQWNTSPEEAALRLLEEGGAGLVSFNMNPSDLENFMRREWVATASDGSTVPWGRGKPHPRAYGTFPRKIARYVREQGVLTLAAAIRSATSLPASIARIPERGWIRPGYFADLVIFDLEKLEDRATYENPHQYAQGVVYLMVNGTLVIETGSYNGKLAGRVLRK